jgi:hypothetical protein
MTPLYPAYIDPDDCALTVRLRTTVTVTPSRKIELQHQTLFIAGTVAAKESGGKLVFANLTGNFLSFHMNICCHECKGPARATTW